MKRTIVLIPTLLAGLVAVGAARRHRRLSTVARELRHPTLYVPMSMRNDTALRAGRRMFAATPIAPAVPGVHERAERVPAHAGGTPSPAVRVMVYEAEQRTRPNGALVWIHGGGMVMGAAQQARPLCSRLAAELGIVVISVDYRLAPEHPFPAALDDCYAALEWIHRHAEALGIDTAKVAIGGDSAGGGLAACLAQMVHDRGGPPVCFQVLEYPMLDDRTALRIGHDAIVWTNASNRYAWESYLGGPLRQYEGRMYAAASRRVDLTGLPPAWIGVGDIDLFHDEATEYGDRLRAAGVACDTYVVPGMYHAADQFVPESATMKAFVAQMISALAAAIA